MIKDNVAIIFANTWDELTVKMIGYHHDHCWHYYSGLTKDIPNHLREFVTKDKKYVFIYEEDKPN